MERRRSKAPIARLVIVFLAAFLGIFLFLFIIRGGNGNLFKQPTVSYDETLFDEEKSYLVNYFKEHPPTADTTISAEYSTSFDQSDKSKALYQALLPVSGFYSPKISINESELKNTDDLPKIIKNPSDIDSTDVGIYLLPQEQLDPTVKLLAVDSDYFLDSATQNPTLSGGVFRVLNIKSGSEDNSSKISEGITSDRNILPKKENLLTLNQTGVTALTRRMQSKLNSTGDASQFAAKIADYLKSADYTHTSNEVSFANDCNNNQPMAFCADYKMYQVLDDIGVDIVELTGNHNNDWGASANRETIDFYREKGIKTVGGGKNEEEASIPLEIHDKNTNITMIAVNNSTSTKENGQGASGDHPGANIYNEEKVKTQIQEAKARGDFVIVDIQFFECYSYPDEGEEMPSCDLPITGQEEFFKNIADAGADLIIGTQAHQPQTYELYKNKPIYYGLGNLFFDQTDWPGTSRSLVLTHYFKNGKLIQTKVSPTIYDKNFQTSLMDKNSATNYLTRLTSYYK